MGWWDTISNIGSKVAGAVETLGSKGLGEIATVANKVADFGESAIKNPIVEGFLASNPEIGVAVGGGLSALRIGAAVGQKGSSLLEQFEGGAAKSEPSKPTIEKMAGKRVKAIDLGTNLSNRGFPQSGARPSGSAPPVPNVKSQAQVRAIDHRTKSRHTLGLADHQAKRAHTKTKRK